MSLPLPVVENCDGCGVCCMGESVPPFLDEIDFIPPELQQEVKQYAKLLAAVPYPPGPCLWFDVTTRKCRHHEHRPNVCREFPIGEEDCLAYRVRWGVDRKS